MKFQFFIPIDLAGNISNYDPNEMFPDPVKRGTPARVMSFEDLTQEIKFEIFQRVRSVKYLLRSRCVCRSWNTLITSPSFITAHLKKNVLMKSKYEYLLTVRVSAKQKCFSLYSAETYAQCSEFEFLIPEDKLGSYLKIEGSCNGLLCISTRKFSSSCTSPIYLWNPSIRKFRQLPERFTAAPSCVYIGLGFQPGEHDYKVVRIVMFRESTGFLGCQVEVYSVRLNSWRRIDTAVPLSRLSFDLQEKSIYFSGVIYWVASEYPTSRSTVGVRAHPRCILAFDMSSENFRKIVLPNELVNPNPNLDSIYIRVLDNALSVFHLDWKSFSADIWVLEKDDTWQKIRSIRLPSRDYIAWPLGFTTNGEVHITRRNGEVHNTRRNGEVHITRRNSCLVLYDIRSRPVKEIEIPDVATFIDAYTESLILLW